MLNGNNKFSYRNGIKILPKQNNAKNYYFLNLTTLHPSDVPSNKNISCSVDSYLVRTNRPWSVIESYNERRQEHEQEHHQEHQHHVILQTVEKQAKKHQALCNGLSINGGPFQFEQRNSTTSHHSKRLRTTKARTGTRTAVAACGPMVFNGTVKYDDIPSDYIGFGSFSLPSIDNNKNNNNVTFGQPLRSYWISGNYYDIQQRYPKALSAIEYFVTGFGWLVYDGQNVADEDNLQTTSKSGSDVFDNSTYVGEKTTTRAPRTAIGLIPRRKRKEEEENILDLFLFVSDGCEKWYVLLISIFPLFLLRTSVEKKMLQLL